MRSHRRSVRYPALVLIALAFAISASCGGGSDNGGGNNTPDPLDPTFAPDSPTPAALSVSLQAAGVAGESFSVDVMLTDTADVLGAAFQIDYDPAIARFNTMSSTGSFLLDGNPAQAPFFDASAATPGRVTIAASRFQGDGGIGVVGTRRLVRLNFTALRTSNGSAIDFAGNLEVSSSANCSPCDPIGVTWAGGSVVVTR